MQAGVAAGSSTYRLWIYTSAQDTGGAKGHLTLKLAGTLGEVTFAHLERSAARQGTLFAPGKCKLSYAYSPASPSDPCNISGIPTWAVD